MCTAVCFFFFPSKVMKRSFLFDFANVGYLKDSELNRG